MSKQLIKAIIFDFDGVIVDSVNVKTEAFAALYKDYGEEIVAKVVEYHEQHGGISRYEKFRYYHQVLLGKEISETEVQDLAQQFSNLVLERVVKAPYVAGIYEFLAKNYSVYDFYVSSGTPQEELRKIVKARNLETFFKGVYGSPVKKAVHVEKILAATELSRENAVFIGDATTDRDAARATNLKFIARIDGEHSLLKEEKYQVNDFVNFDIFIQNALST